MLCTSCHFKRCLAAQLYYVKLLSASPRPQELCICCVYTFVVFSDALGECTAGHEASEGSGQVVLSQLPLLLLQVVLQLFRL